MDTIRRLLYYLVVFVLALAIRSCAIEKTSFTHGDIDLSIYRNSGQLIANGINPYDHGDNREKRQSLRTDHVAFNEYVCASQERWDYYAGSNLPLTVLLFGAIESLARFATPSAHGYASAGLYRYSFALLDSLLAVLIAAFVMRHWHDRPGWYRQVLVLGLGVGNPVLLYQGTIVPQDKGVQILLMLAAIHCARQSARPARLLAAPILLAASVMFKGIGIFLVPWLFYVAVLEPQEPAKEKRKAAALFSLAFLIACVLVLYPFIEGLAAMVETRLTGSTTASPSGAAIWRIVQLVWPDQWSIIRHATIGGMLALTAWRLTGGRKALDEGAASCLLVFTSLVLVASTLDRMNMALLTCVVLVGYKRAYRELPRYYVFGGLIVLLNFLTLIFVSRVHLAPSFLALLVSDRQYVDSLFTFGFIALFCKGLLRSAGLRPTPEPPEEGQALPNSAGLQPSPKG